MELTKDKKIRIEIDARQALEYGAEVEKLNRYRHLFIARMHELGYMCVDLGVKCLDWKQQFDHLPMRSQDIIGTDVQNSHDYAIERL